MSVDFTPSRGEYTELKPFRYWCQKVLPLVYDDSLSYYELLSKVLDSLNKAMEDVETLNDDVTALYTAYDSLQNWVNDYVETFFEGEGIADAVDDALDRMVVSGEFGSIVNDKVAAQINAVVASQLGTVVQGQLPSVVQTQINPVVANQLPGVVNNQIGAVADTWLQAHVQSQTGTLDHSINSSGSAPLSFPLKNLIQGNKGAYSFVDKYLLADYTDTDYHNDVIIFKNIFKDNFNPPDYPYGVRSKFYKKGNTLVMTSYPDPSDDNPWEINAYPSVIPITRNLIPPLDDSWDASTNDAVALTLSGLSGLDKNAINKYFVNINSGDTIKVAFDLNLTHVGDFNGFISLEHWKLIKVYVSNNAVTSQDLAEFTITANSSGAGTLLSKVHGECEYTFDDIDKETPGNPATIGFGLAIVTGENISWGHYSGNTNYMARSNTYEMTITGEVVDPEVADLKQDLTEPTRLRDAKTVGNFFDKTHATTGVALNRLNGKTYVAQDSAVSEYIEVDSGEVYSFPANVPVAFYDASKTYVSGSYVAAATVPQNAKYMRVSLLIENIDTFFVCKGIYGYQEPYLIDYPWLKQEVTGDQIADIAFLNMFDKEKAIIGSYVDTSTGGRVNNNQQCASVYMSAKELTSYRTNYAANRYACYNANREFISGGISNSFTTPQNTKYVVVSFPISEKETYLICEADYFTGDYYPHYIGIVPWIKANAPKSKYDGKQLVCFGDSITNLGYVDAIYQASGIIGDNVGLSSGRYAAVSSPVIDAFSFYRIAYAISTGDWTIPDSISGVTGYESQYARIQQIKALNFNEKTFISIAYGTNDFSSGTILDNENNPLDTATFKGAIRYSLKLLTEKYPHLKIIGVTPCFRFESENGVITDDSDTMVISGKKEIDYVNAIIEVYTEYHLPVINNLTNGGINRLNCLEYFGINDGLHPNQKGRDIIGNRIASGLLLNY